MIGMTLVEFAQGTFLALAVWIVLATLVGWFSRWHDD